MFDELGRLASDQKLRDLLENYGTLGVENRELWQPRLSVIEGVDAPGLSRLFGALIAFGWLEQNTGGPGCSYRITASGQRALRRVRNAEDLDEEILSEAA
jgi:hypothetical protein